MKKIFKIIVSIVILGLSFYACSNYAYKSSFGIWKMEKSSDAEIVWAEFLWTNQTINGKFYEKTAMLIHCKMEGIENNLSFQFDTGSGRTMVYEKSLSSLYFKNKKLTKKLHDFKFPATFSRNNKLFKDLNISFGQYRIFNESALLLGGYGSELSSEQVNDGDTIHMGTIGSDILQGKVLIIDYPSQKFAICDKIPTQFNKNLIDIELDRNGKPVLPLLLNSNRYRVLFDNGSSLFPIIAATKNIPKFSSNPVLDSIEISSWGKKHFVDSRMITDTFKIAGKAFSHVEVYESHTDLGMDRKTDGMVGNFLFWDTTIVIDFKNKKFGIH